MTREEDILLYDKTSDYHGHKKEQDLATRRRMAEQYDRAVFVSIHMNAFPDSRYKGLQVYYSENHPDSQLLAKSIQAKDRLYLHPDNRRAVKSGGSNLYLLDRLTCPAVLVECGFLSTDEECEALCREDTQKKLVLLLAASVLEILSEDTEIVPTAS
jgi:N-acetylmuramoyl-L-alanine amidase